MTYREAYKVVKKAGAFGRAVNDKPSDKLTTTIAKENRLPQARVNPPMTQFPVPVKTQAQQIKRGQRIPPAWYNGKYARQYLRRAQEDTPYRTFWQDFMIRLGNPGIKGM